MGRHDKSSEGDTLTERQGQVNNAERRKCNDIESTTRNIFYSKFCR